MSRRHRPGSLTRQATSLGDKHWRTWEMVKNRKTIGCMDCFRPFPRGVMMFRPKSYEPTPSRQRICSDCAKRM